jgi:hypothetical protein
MRDAHRQFRERLHSDQALKPLVIDSFLQGSYRRATLVQPSDGKSSDVDIVVATRMSEKQYSPQQALETFIPFLNKHYTGAWEVQGRSIGVSVGRVKLDLVPTSAPSEVLEKALRSESVRSDRTLEESGWVPSEGWNAATAITSDRSLLLERAQWQIEPLRIPDREARQWDDTHPLEQIRWTWEKNRRTDGYYINIVKAVKWWRRLNPLPKYPKGYPIEHLVGLSCPEGVASVAEGITLTLSDIVIRYANDANAGRVPFTPDHGVPTHNVLHRLSSDDFRQLHSLFQGAATLARAAYDSPSRSESTRLWQQLFSDRFPSTPDEGGDGGGGYTPRKGPTVIPPAGERWA